MVGEGSTNKNISNNKNPEIQTWVSFILFCSVVKKRKTKNKGVGDQFKSSI